MKISSTLKIIGKFIGIIGAIGTLYEWFTQPKPTIFTYISVAGLAIGFLTKAVEGLEKLKKECELEDTKDQEKPATKSYYIITIIYFFLYFMTILYGGSNYNSSDVSYGNFWEVVLLLNIVASSYCVCVYVFGSIFPRVANKYEKMFVYGFWCPFTTIVTVILLQTRNFWEIIVSAIIATIYASLTMLIPHFVMKTCKANLWS